MLAHLQVLGTKLLLWGLLQIRPPPFHPLNPLAPSHPSQLEDAVAAQDVGSVRRLLGENSWLANRTAGDVKETPVHMAVVRFVLFYCCFCPPGPFFARWA